MVRGLLPDGHFELLFGSLFEFLDRPKTICDDFLTFVLDILSARKFRWFRRRSRRSDVHDRIIITKENAHRHF